MSAQIIYCQSFSFTHSIRGDSSLKKQLFNHTIFLAIVACFLWATAFVAIKIGLQYTTPLKFAGIRFFISGCIILPFIKNFRQSLFIIKQHYPTIVLIGFIQTTLLYALFYLGLERVPASLGAMLVGAGPLFAALVAHFVLPNDKLTMSKLWTILLGLCGIIIISLNKGNGSDGSYPFLWFGVLALLANNIVGGVGNVMVAKYGKPIPSMMLSSFSLIFGGFVLFLISIPVEGISWDRVYHPIYYLSLGWLSFLSAAAITIWFSLLKRPNVKVSHLNTWKFIIPVLGAILSWGILPDEHPTLLSLLGMSIIAIALVLFNSRWVRK